ncbi:hypothetical protein UPYG_G00035110 [Umbra pygmaea]|uniref:RNA polymerase II elongation factor ELL N-terminal domain-containing protein n=1 Tax=Umbra pygmaea TaxID=75934 RepID=A0ABD0XNQ2_UMBPY
MAALKEEQCYGLSCGQVSNGSNVSVFHVKLTDSALRAFEGYQNFKGLSSQPLIRFTGNQGASQVQGIRAHRAGLLQRGACEHDSMLEE